MGDEMSAPTGYQQPPVAGKPKPGIAGIIIGAALMVIGFAAGLGLILSAAVSSSMPVLNAPTNPSDSTVKVQLTAGDTEGLWASGFPSLTVTIQDPSGNQLDCVPSSMATNVNNFFLLCTFAAPVSGEYTVYVSGGDFKVAPPMKVAGLAGGIIGGVMLMIFLPLGGLALLIVTIVRRSKWDRENAAPPVYPQINVPGPTQYPA